VAGLMVLIACGGSSSPAAPTPPPPPPPFEPGVYSLGIGVSLDRSGCEGTLPLFGATGPLITGQVMLSSEGGAWVGRPASEASGTIELRLSVSGTGDFLNAAGTVQGRLDSIFNTLPEPSPIRQKEWATVTHSTPVTGLLLPALSAGRSSFVGDISGVVEFTSSTGGHVVCSTARLVLSGPMPQLPFG